MSSYDNECDMWDTIASSERPPTSAERREIGRSKRARARRAGAPDTLTTTEAGITRDIAALDEGEYIWHDGAFRRVLSVQGRTVKMAGNHVLQSNNASTVEVAR